MWTKNIVLSNSYSANLAGKLIRKYTNKIFFACFQFYRCAGLRNILKT